VQIDGLVAFAIGYLQENGVKLPAYNCRGSASRLTRREQLAEMVMGLMSADGGEHRFRLLQDSVRQKRASLVREGQKRSIKRLDLKDSVCAKLESMSKFSRLRQSTLVENLINDEAAIRRGESFALKKQRQLIKADFKVLYEKETELKARDARLAQQEKSFSGRLARLAAFEKLVNAIMKCAADDLDVRVDVSAGGSVENLFTFASPGGSSEELKPVADAWDEVLSHLGSHSVQS